MLRSPVKPGQAFCLEQLKNNSISIRAISKLKWYYPFSLASIKSSRMGLNTSIKIPSLAQMAPCSV